MEIRGRIEDAIIFLASQKKLCRLKQILTEIETNWPRLKQIDLVWKQINLRFYSTSNMYIRFLSGSTTSLSRPDATYSSSRSVF